jgi:branched-chain amino acid transport system permease protein
MGVNLPFTKTVTFGISAAIAGASGWVTAARLSTMDQNSFTILTSINYLLALFLGGAATLTGPVVGAFAYYFANDYLKSHAPNWDWLPGPLSEGPVASFLLGVLVIAFVFVAPFGLVGLLQDLATRVRVRRAAISPRTTEQRHTGSPGEASPHSPPAPRAESAGERTS